jgi:hypothetical protein
MKQNKLRYLYLIFASTIGVILAFATCANAIFASDNSQQPILSNYRLNEQNGIFDISMYEFEDVSNNTWIELKILLDKDWVQTNLRQSHTQSTEEEYARRFVSYMSRVVNWIDMVQVDNDLDSAVIGVVARSKYKQNSKLIGDNLVSSEIGVFNVYKTFEYDNPLGQLWQGVQSGNPQSHNRHRLTVLQQLASVWYSGDSKIVNGNKLEIGTLFEELKISQRDLVQSKTRYSVSFNRYLDTRGHNTALISKRNFVYFDSILSDTGKIQLRTVSPNSVGYNIVLIVAGVVTVLIVYIIAHKAHNKTIV